MELKELENKIDVAMNKHISTLMRVKDNTDDMIKMSASMSNILKQCRKYKLFNKGNEFMNRIYRII